MRNSRHIGLAALVAVVVTTLAAAALVVAQERRETAAPVRQDLVQPAAARTPELRLAATPRTVDAGARVTLRIRTSTKHARSVRVQRWDARAKAWRQVTRRTVRASASVVVTPPTGTTRYRATTPRLRHRVGGRTHTHRAGTSASVAVTARVRIVAHRDATLSADERTLLNAVTTARRTYARPAVTAATDEGADACLTAYAREHSAWMAKQGRAVDPGAREHRAAGRTLPAAACPGRTVWAVTRAIGGSGPAGDAAARAVDAWLSSPYGETTRLLTACHDAPAFEYGVAAPASGGARWLTVLVASSAASTRSAGVC